MPAAITPESPRPDASTVAPQPALMANYRWVICALLFFATTINYIDRQILSLLKEILDKQIGWTNEQFGWVNSAFQFSYGIGLLGFGWFVDRFGTKIGYTVSIIAWSISAAAHALVGSFAGFLTARSALGLGEAGNFPSAIKAVALWFPKRERAFATSIFNAGTNAGALVAPAIIPWMAYTFGWQSCFIAAGIAGLLWLFLWIPFYDVPDKCKRVGAAELVLIRSDREEEQPKEKIPWLSLLGYRQTWSFIIAKFLTDPVWWFFLIWLPDYLQEDPRPGHQEELDTHRHHLRHRDGAQHLRRLGHGLPDQAGLDGDPGAQDRHVHFCAVRSADSRGDQGRRLDSGAADRPGRFGPPGMVGEPLHYRVRHVPQAGRGFGDRHWRHGRLGGGHPVPGAHGRLLDYFQKQGNITAGYAILFGICACMYLVAFALNHLCAPRFEPFPLRVFRR